MTTHYVETFDSPLGIVEVTASEKGVISIYFVEKHAKNQNKNIHSSSAVTQLREYFVKSRTQFDLTLEPVGTEFQKSVWQALLAVQYGETVSYSDIANAIDKPKAVRAVGAANGKNPLSIVVPCHRIIGKNGALTGYAGGMDRKAALLVLEKEEF
ncbi:methylated-DNA--[protein]-cysteine S-methyltransferase [Alteromonas sp. 5E99-2]|uniref:methylated-DNA--[protein]-cysteine S-methyltransferase n=1 Tax=Alteromonas sp. 5E99-2 TaxID=2817683 RepID=UPI001A997D4D|nr:methylated-DNA--[protein]-cysteine S-methyltransferase [Alteromonas sp. 5E99-2]MBO1256887.1 methylated-DNA--[protein]-cysteine S-methyltransferase [Alteromonas sp. 5E99-2]